MGSSLSRRVAAVAVGAGVLLATGLLNVPAAQAVGAYAAVDDWVYVPVGATNAGSINVLTNDTVTPDASVTFGSMPDQTYVTGYSESSAGDIMLQWAPDAPAGASVDVTYTVYQPDFPSLQGTVHFVGGLAVPVADEYTNNGFNQYFSVLDNDQAWSGSTVHVGIKGTKGTVSVLDNNQVSYTPADPEAKGIDTFYYWIEYTNLAEDQFLVSDVVPVTVHLAGLTHYPTAVTLTGPKAAGKDGAVNLSVKFDEQRTIQSTSLGRSGTLGATPFVDLYASVNGKPFTLVDSQRVVFPEAGSLSTSPPATVSGVVLFSEHQSATTVYEARFAGVGTFEPSTSKRVTVTTPSVVKVPAVTLKASAASVRKGGTVVVTASTSPVRKGVHVKLQKLIKGSWVTFANQVTDAAGVHSFRWPATTLGSYSMRVITGDLVSNTVTFTVTR